MVWVQVLKEQVVGGGFVSGVSLKPTSTGFEGDSLLNGLNWLKVIGEVVKASIEFSKFNVRVFTAPW